MLKTETKLPRADYPEQVGVSSKGVSAFIKEITDKKLNIHSLMVTRHNKVAYECEWKPFKAEFSNAMFSFSKVITSLAVGLAYDDGYLTPETKVYSFFPEYLEKLKGKQRKYAEELSVHHLITMQSGKVDDMLFVNTEKIDWVDRYLKVRFKARPGTKYEYISQNIFMLAVVVIKATGQNLTEYLTKRLYEPLGMETPVWEGDHNGFEAGGWGLNLSREQMAKIGSVFLNGGCYEGKRIISEEWFKICTTGYNDKVNVAFNHNTDYGYQVWLMRDDNAIRFEGLFGQIAIMFKDYDGMIVFNSGEAREDLYLPIILKHYRNFFCDEEEYSEEKYNTYKNFTDSLKNSPNFKNGTRRLIELEKKYSGRTAYLKSRGNVSLMGFPAFFMYSKKCGKMSSARLDFYEDKATFTWQEKNSPLNTIDVGFDDYLYSECELAGLPVKTAAMGTWNTDGSFELYVQPLGKPQNRRIKFYFKNNKLKMKMNTEASFYHLAIFFIQFKGMKLNWFIEEGLKPVISVINAVWADPNTYGKFE